MGFPSQTLPADLPAIRESLQAETPFPLRITTADDGIVQVKWPQRSGHWFEPVLEGLGYLILTVWGIGSVFGYVVAGGHWLRAFEADPTLALAFLGTVLLPFILVHFAATLAFVRLIVMQRWEAIVLGRESLTHTAPSATALTPFNRWPLHTSRFIDGEWCDKSSLRRHFPRGETVDVRLKDVGGGEVLLLGGETGDIEVGANLPKPARDWLYHAIRGWLRG